MPQIPLQDGGSLSFRDEGQGQALVLLHGWGMRKEVFDSQFAGLAGRFRLIAPDLRGHGESTPASNDGAIPTLADDIGRLLEHLDVDQAVIVGWSMGAMVAWALMHGPAAKRVAGIVAIDMVPRILNDVTWQHGLRDGEDASAFANDVARMRQDWARYVDEFVPRNVAHGREKQRSALLTRLSALIRDNDPESMARLWQSLAEQDMRQSVTELHVPLLIAHGELSQLYDEAAFAWMERNIPNSRRVSFADSGHAPHLEESERFNAVLEQFVDGLRGEPTDASTNRQHDSQPERPS